jgi:hypothetical protein
MSKFEWKGFTPTPAEKYAGIAEIKIHGETPIVLRFKIVARKDGTGHFPNVGSYKMPDRMPGEEYDECFMLDSRSDHDAAIKFVMHNFHLWQQGQQPSVFTPQPAKQQVPYPAQPNPNYGAYPQPPQPPAQMSFMDPPDYGNPPF